MTSKFNIDGDAIRQLAEILVDTELTEIEYEDDGRRIRVSRGGGIQHMVGTAAPTPLIAPEPALAPHSTNPQEGRHLSDHLSLHPGAVKSPMVGTAYLCPEPGAAPFVRVGDTVSMGQTLMIIEAMKVMNPIKAPRSGKIMEILIQEGSPIEYGEPLMVIE